MDKTSQIMLSAAYYIWQEFGEGPNIVLSEAGANQTKWILRKKIRCAITEKLGTSHTAEPTIKKVLNCINMLSS
jgi:hypothetical protein